MSVRILHSSLVTRWAVMSSIVSNVAANDLYVLEEEAMWKIGVLDEV